MSSEPDLIHLARTHLGLQSSSTIPRTYLDQLKTHLSIYPFDTNFRIFAQPNAGYGKIHCQEGGCRDQANGTIDLEPNSMLSDGGLRDGIGALVKYRQHIVQHPTHLRKRNERIKSTPPSSHNTHAGSMGSVQSIPTNTASVKKERSTSSLLDALDARSPFGSQGHAKSTTGQNRNPPSVPPPSSSLPRNTPQSSATITRPRLSSTPSSSSQLKAEHIEPILSLKRPISDLGVSTGSGSPSAKRLKKEPSFKGPLEAIDNNTPATSNGGLGSQESLRRLQSELSHKRSILDSLLRKPKKTPADHTRMAQYSQEIEDLNHQIAYFKQQSLPSVTYVVPQPRWPQPEVRPTVASLDISPSPAGRHASGHSIANQDVIGRTAAPRPWLTSPSAPVAGPSTTPGRPQAPMPALTVDHMDIDSDPSAVTNAIVQDFGAGLPNIAPMHNPYDENGDFYGRGRDTFRGPIASAEELTKFFMDAGNVEQFDGSATVEKALDKLGLSSIHSRIPGMDVPLMPHQVIGVAWMIEKEKKLNGGCLADEMGLGKTVQMIAVMAKNRSSNPKCKTNLILAPLALLDQWKLEIETKTGNLFNCLIYHGQSKTKSKSELLKYDVVITTYNTMAMEWPDIEGQEKKRKKARKSKADDFIVDDSADEGSSSKTQKRGLLFEVDFYRIILDEAQNIRNKKTRTSRAVTELEAKYRWGLTGTPITNSLSDAYPLIRFLQIRPWYDWKEFNQHIALYEKKQAKTAVIKLQKVMEIFLLRRKKDTMLDGKRLIEIPDRNVELVRLTFSDEEREIYKMVESKSQAIFNRYLKAGTVLKNYSQVMVLLLRLRQVCNHPCLILEDGSAFIRPDEWDHENMPADIRRELARARDLVSPQFVVQVKERLKNQALKRLQAENHMENAAVEDEECPVCFDALTDAIITPCGHIFCRDCIEEVLKGPRIEDAENATKYQQNERPCPTCRAPISSERFFSLVAFEPTDAELNPPPPGSEKDDSDVEIVDISPKKTAARVSKKRRKRNPTSDEPSSYGVVDIDTIVPSDDEDEFELAPRRVKTKRRKQKSIVLDSDEEEDTDDYDSFIVDSDEDEEEEDRRALKKRLGKRKAREVIELSSDSEDEKEVIHGRKKKPTSPEAIKCMPRFLPSTKMKKMIEEIVRLAKYKPEEKTLVVSQWTSCLSLVSDYLTEYNILHVKYQGDMNRSQREQAVRVFMSKDKAPIMLMSMKCGGVGLNLTRANNVISLDLGWSPATESQAFDRVHRLGQTKAVNIQRLVIEDTVEDRILALQERKQNLADGSLGEGTGKKVGKMTVSQLAGLFGLSARGRVLGV